MKSNVLRSVLLACGALGVVASGAAQADHWHRGGVRFGVYLGAPYWGAPYYAPHYYNYPPSYYYYPSAPVVVAPSTAPIYIENNAATQIMPQAAPATSPPPVAAAPRPASTWYYCRDAQAYYPYVRECKSAWEPVPATPQ